MNPNEAPNQKSFASIQRYNGQILGAILWVPASVFEKCIEPGQEEVEISFEVIGKEVNPAVQAGHEHPAGTPNEG